MSPPPPLHPTHNQDRNPTSLKPSVPSELLSRRGIRVDGLALVAPPDASVRSYTNLTPPTSAPIVPDRVQISSYLPQHHRAASEAVRYQGTGHLARKSSRDIGIVGTASQSPGLIRPAKLEDYHAYAERLKPPVFQTPSKSRTPSPGRASPMYDDRQVKIYEGNGSPPFLGPKSFGVDAALLTPAIGEGKDINQPVVGPVVVQLSSELLDNRQPLAEIPSPAPVSTPALTNSSPTVYSPMSSSYRYYEPGVHSIAGPLPPPPIILDSFQRTPPPPRPPRLNGANSGSSRPDVLALKEALQLPKSVSAALASKSSSDRMRTPSPSTSNISQHDNQYVTYMSFRPR